MAISYQSLSYLSLIWSSNDHKLKLFVIDHPIRNRWLEGGFNFGDIFVEGDGRGAISSWELQNTFHHRFTRMRHNEKRWSGMWHIVVFLGSLSYWTSAQITDHAHDQPILKSTDITDNCCIYLDDESKLLDCANRSAFQFVLNSIPLIAAVSYSTEGILDYGAYSMAVNTYYTQLHGYGMVLLTPGLGAQYEPRDQRWNKVKILMNALDPLTGWAKDSEFIIWLDSDLIFLDMGLEFEGVVKAHPSYDIIFSADADVQNGTGCL
jgi:hypothetical protein